MGSDIVTTLFVNYEWRRIISDALQSYFDYKILSLADVDIDDVRNKFQALLNDLYTTESGTMTVVQLKAERITDINFTANLDVPVVFNSGYFDATNNSRIYASATGKAIVTATVHIATLSTATIMYAFIRRDGTSILARNHIQVAASNQELVVTWSGDVTSGEYLELCVRSSANSKVSVLNAPAHLAMTIISPS